MRKSLFMCLLLPLAGLAAGGYPARFMTHPDISGNQLVFTYEDDLWLADANGGTARRLTSNPGSEFSARFSPDGKWIAFTASYDGSQAVYVIPADGKTAPLRLTYNPGGAQSLGWTPDGKKIFFRSNVENFIFRDPNLFFVSMAGGPPERFPTERGVLASFSPDGSKMLYVRKGNEEYQWKRYRGGQYCDIWHYDFSTRQFSPVTDFVGKNAYPMWIGQKMYFVSDRDRIANIWVQEIGGKEARPVTRFKDRDVMWAETDGKNIVFVQDGYLQVLDIASEKTRRVEIAVESDRWRLRERVINPKDYIHDMDVANSGKIALLEARGDVFALPADREAQTLNLSRTPGTREMYPRLSPDGRQVAFFSDKTGDYQLYLQNVAGGEWIPLTTALDKFCYRLEWSPDGKKILFGNKDFAIFVLDVETKILTKIDEYNQLKNDEFYWEIDDYAWSPDSRWVCYSKVAENRNSRIYLYNLETKQSTPVTSDFYDNLNPCFDGNGEYLFFLSSRNFDVTMDFYEDNHVITNPYRVMAVQLRAGQKEPFAVAPEEIKDLIQPVVEKEAGAKGKEKAERAAPVTVDLAGLEGRLFELPVAPGEYFSLKAGKNHLTWCSVPAFTEDEYEEIFKPGRESKWTLHLYDLKKKELVKLEDKIRRYELSVNGEQIIIEKENAYFLNSLEKLYQSKKTGEKLNLDKMICRVVPAAEWNQIFSDCWRWYRDFFYDENMHGQDWKALGEAYRACLPDLSSRDQLNWLLSQLVGELCVGHAYIRGGDGGPGFPAVSPLFPGCLGADLSVDGPSGCYRFEKIFGPTEFDAGVKAPLVRPDMDVKAGDYLLAIDGQPVTSREDYFKYLQVVRGQKVAITVNNRPVMEGARTYLVEPLRSDRNLRYNDWVAGNIRKVREASGGRLGYMHITAMGNGGVAEFDKFWRAFRYKDGVIIDVRRNSGGWTEYFLIDKLERQLAGYNVLRRMNPMRYPGTAGNGNYVVVTNEYNGSDGECFIEHFKARKLGKVVGVPSWGGLVGIVNGQATIDNGNVQQPNNAFYGHEGTWWVENHGADPDIVMDNDPQSFMAGHDRQLEKAIEVALQQIEQTKPAFPPRPAYPKR